MVTCGLSISVIFDVFLGVKTKWMFGLRTLLGIGFLVTSQGGKVLSQRACSLSQSLTRTELPCRALHSMAHPVKYLG